MRARTLALALVVLGGCGQILGIGDLRISDGGPDEAHGDSDTSDGPSILISGDTRVIATQAMPQVFATIDVIQISDGKQLATTTPDASDAFSVRVPTHGAPLDAYLRVSYAGYLSTHAYLVPLLDHDSPDNHVLIAKQADLEDIATMATTQQPATKGFILAQIFAANQPATGASGSVLPASDACYTDATQHPLCAATATATANDGLVWFFGVAPGPVTVSGQLADTTPLQSRQAAVEAGTFIYIGLEP